MGSRAAKRQRQKEQRRAKIEEEIRRHNARRRKRAAINLSILVVVIGAIASAVFLQGRGDDEPSATSTPTPSPKPRFSQAPPMTIDPARTYTAVLETSQGTIEFVLAPDKSPNTVNSFVFLVSQGFYDGLTFHRIVPGFALQGGDPEGDGSGGPGYSVVDPPPPDTRYTEGVVAMAKSGAEAPGTSGSQFFIVPGDGAATLPPEYAVLGTVTAGQDVVAKINAVPVDGETPRETVRIVKLTIRQS